MKLSNQTRIAPKQRKRKGGLEKDVRKAHGRQNVHPRHQQITLPVLIWRINLKLPP